MKRWKLRWYLIIKNKTRRKENNRNKQKPDQSSLGKSDEAEKKEGNGRVGA